MAKFNLLTSIILDKSGYTKGINAATKETQQFASKLNEASKGVTSTMSSMGGMVGEIGDAVSSLAGAATGIGLVTAAVGILVSTLKTAKENMDLYLESADKVGMGSGGFLEDAEKVRKDARKRGRGGVRVEQEIISKSFLDAGKLYRDIQNETDEAKKKILQTTLNQTLEEYRSAKIALEKNKAIKEQLRGRQAGIVFEAQYRKLALEQTDIEETKERAAKEFTHNEEKLISLKRIINSQTATESEKNAAMAEFEKIATDIKTKKLALIDREILNVKAIGELTNKKEGAEKKTNELLNEREDIEKNNESAMLKAEKLQNKITKSVEKANKEKEKQQKLQDDFIKESLTAQQEVIIKQQTTEEQSALKTREFKYINDVEAAKEKYNGMQGLNQMLTDLETAYQVDVANIKADYYDKDVEDKKKAEEQKLKDAKEKKDKELEQEKTLLEDKRSLAEADYADGKMNYRQYLKELMDIELANTELTEAMKLEIKAKYAKEFRNMDIQDIQFGLGLASQAADKLSGIFNIQKEKELRTAGNNAKKKEDIERKYAEKQKAISLARAIIATALAVTENLAVVWKAIAVGALGAIEIGTIASTKFAKGGIVSSPTNALIGEYPNAKNNPEVVAPLSKLTELLNIGGGEVTFRIEGTTLVGVLANQNRKLYSYR